jgi:arylsulfatase A-like enzyme
MLPLALLLLASVQDPLPAPAQMPNLLLVLLDDVGVDRVACYGLAPAPPATPTLDRLAAEGILFTNAWAQPYCGPSRAALLTGRYGFRTGIGTNVEHGRGVAGLELDEVLLPELLGTHRSAACGKWHLASFDQGDRNALEQGFERSALTQGNLGDYFAFTKQLDGRPVQVQRYATTDTVDDTLRLATEFGDDPWFIYVPLHASHVPFHEPPEALHSSPTDTDPGRHRAAVEAADAELGRLLRELPAETLARTIVIVVGDNGTPRPAIEAPFDPEHGKGTLFEGSLHVPLIVWGAPAAPRGARCEALVSTVDLFTTGAALLGVDARQALPPGRELDGLDLSALLADPTGPGPREVLFAERFEPNHSAEPTRLWRAARGVRFKLIRNVIRGRDRLFDLRADPHEQHDLLGDPKLDPEAAAALERLSRSLVEIPGGQGR